MFGRWFSKRATARFARNRRGNVAMLWGLTASVLVGMTGLTIDFTRAQVIKAQIQNAADGAALVAARNASSMSLTDRTALAKAYFDAEAGEYGTGATFSLTPLDDNTYQVNVQTSMPGSLTKLISQRDWSIGVESQAIHGGTNVEVSLVLDTTGSMSGSKISDLRGAATDFVNTVVNDVQTPFYSKVALVTFSAGVNVGGYSTTMHGAVAGGVNISGASWASGSAKTITGISKHNTAVVTSANHGFSTGDVVYFSGVKGGMTSLNGHYYTITKVDSNSFSINGVNSSSWSSWSSGGTQTVTKCQTSACEIVVTTTASHGFTNGSYVVICGVGGMTQINNASSCSSTSAASGTWQVASPTSTTFVLSGSTGPSYSSYSSSGTAYCTTLGCQWYRFTNASNSTVVWPISASCVTERTGAHAYDDVSPGTALVGYNYPAPSDSNSRCPTTSIIPLTANKTTLNNQISTLAASGYTAGQVGTAWGWYMISPNWGSLWPADENRPAAYGAPATAKVAVIMTDGTYNMTYCNGVMSKDAGSGSNSNHINCNATNGDGGVQAQTICTAMKNAGIIIYTVGFDMSGEPQSSTDMLTNCATAPSYFYNASDGTALHAAFASIATSISNLRISH